MTVAGVLWWRGRWRRRGAVGGGRRMRPVPHRLPSPHLQGFVDLALVATFYLTAAIFVIGVLGAVGIANGFSIFKLIRYLKEELLLVLGTSSSEAALPSLIEKMGRAGCDRSARRSWAAPPWASTSTLVCWASCSSQR